MIEKNIIRLPHGICKQCVEKYLYVYAPDNGPIINYWCYCVHSRMSVMVSYAREYSERGYDVDEEKYLAALEFAKKINYLECICDDMKFTLDNEFDTTAYQTVTEEDAKEIADFLEERLKTDPNIGIEYREHFEKFIKFCRNVTLQPA